MLIRRLQVTDLRCLRQIDLEPHPGLNVIEGDNGSGKTSLLEAIYILGRGRSFRATALAELRRDGSDGFCVVGRVEEDGRLRVVGLRWAEGRLEARVAGRPLVALAELAEVLAVQVVDPDVHKLVEEGPQRRRRFLDWGVFHVEQGFLEAWRRYRRALRQRNVLLKQNEDNAELAPWEIELGAAGAQIDTLRQRYVSRLGEELDGYAQRLLGEAVECRYRRGWAADRDLRDVLREARPRDRQYGQTMHGPHRADFQITVQGHGARGRVSRGQQKLIAAALTLAQMRLLQRATGRGGVLLLDDPAAELDRDRLATLLEGVRALQVQLFLTVLPETELPGLAAHRRFHVEHGALRPML
jgi:DNA replication and repair protein RecF